jgi:hypothetical protein
MPLSFFVLDTPGDRHVSRPLTEAKKNAAKFLPTKAIAEHILTNAQDNRPVVQDFVPLAEVSTESMKLPDWRKLVLHDGVIAEPSECDGIVLLVRRRRENGFQYW